MFKQNDLACYSKEIANYGCYFMCILYIFSREFNIKLTKEEIYSIYNYMVSKGYMTKMCYIISPDLILRELCKMYNVRLSRVLTITDKVYQRNKYKYTIAKISTVSIPTHFVVIADITSNNEVLIDYEPDIRLTKAKYTVVDIDSFRYINIEV